MILATCDSNAFTKGNCQCQPHLGCIRAWNKRAFLIRHLLSNGLMQRRQLSLILGKNHDPCVDVKLIEEPQPNESSRLYLQVRKPTFISALSHLAVHGFRFILTFVSLRGTASFAPRGTGFMSNGTVLVVKDNDRSTSTAIICHVCYIFFSCQTEPC